MKRFKQRKKAHENRLQNLNQEIANKDPMAEAVRTARFQAAQDIGIQSLTVVACKQRVFEFFLLSSFSFVIVLQPFFEQLTRWLIFLCRVIDQPKMAVLVDSQCRMFKGDAANILKEDMADTMTWRMNVL